MKSAHAPAHIAIACGGTGGHLYPGLAVAEGLRRRQFKVSLFISSKPVDHQAVPREWKEAVITLPAIGWQSGRWGAFLAKSWQSYRTARSAFGLHPPQAVLAMGGFTSAPAVWAGRSLGAATFLHEANYLPGKANRWLAPWVDAVFVHFPETAPRLGAHAVFTTGMPVRGAFHAGDPAASRRRFGLDPQRPLILVMGGSQGAHGINRLVLDALPFLSKADADTIQFLHLSGSADREELTAAYAARGIKATVRAFTSEMEAALDAATIVVSRAGASSLAELAAMQSPAILIPYPHAADNHQWFNARAFVETGAARMLEQRDARPEEFAECIRDFIGDGAAHDKMKRALGTRHRAHATETLIEHLLEFLGARGVLIAGRGSRSMPAAPQMETDSASAPPVSRRGLEAPAP